MSYSTSTINITLTDFVNFIAGYQNKASVVNNIISRQKRKNSFFSQYYIPLQQSILAYHQQARQEKILWNTMQQLKRGSKDYSSQLQHYPPLIENYLITELAKTKTCKSLPTAQGYFLHKNLSIKINPELHLQYKKKGTKILKNHFIKLYYKEQALDNKLANQVIALMEHSMPPTSDFPTEYCILDLRRGKLFYKDMRIKHPMRVNRGEAESFLSIWNSTHSSLSI